MTGQPRFTVVVTDQVFPSVETERQMLAGIGAGLVIADGTSEGVAAVAAGADALLNTYLPVTGELLASAPRCRIVARYGIGTDNVDIAAARERGVVVTNVPDYSVEEVAVHTLSLLLALIRRIPDATRLVAAGGWGLDGLRPIRRLSGLRAGLVGYGRIGRTLASYLTALGCEVVVHDPFLTPGPGLPPLVTLAELLAGCDAVSLHAPDDELRNERDPCRRFLEWKRKRNGAAFQWQQWYGHQYKSWEHLGFLYRHDVGPGIYAAG